MKKTKDKTKKEINLKVRDIIEWLPTLQAFMSLPKPAKWVWELSKCFNSQIIPINKAYEDTSNGLKKDLGLDKQFVENIKGESPDEKTIRTNERVDQVIKFKEALEPILDEDRTLNLSKLSGEEYIGYIEEWNANQKRLEKENKPFQPEVNLTVEMLIPWLF